MANNEVNRNIKRAIKRRGFTLRDLAAEMPNRAGGRGVSLANISAIVSGNPTLQTLMDISAVLGCTLSELISDGGGAVGPAAQVPLRCPCCGAVLSARLELCAGAPAGES
jgi:transcriptional regulator with XRE-family HTH domain